MEVEWFVLILVRCELTMAIFTPTDICQNKMFISRNSWFVFQYLHLDFQNKKIVKTIPAFKPIKTSFRDSMSPESSPEKSSSKVSDATKMLIDLRMFVNDFFSYPSRTKNPCLLQNPPRREHLLECPLPPHPELEGLGKQRGRDF